MILVPNRQQLLNGSKLLLALVFLFSLTSCGSSKTVRKSKKTYRPKINRPTKAKASKPKIDTVDWTVTPKEEMPPIVDSPFDALPLYKKSSYNVSLFLPMSGSRQERFEHYYAGAKMALTELEREGVSLNVDVFDTKGSEKEFSSQLKSMNNRFADVIVGPYDKEGVKEAAQYAKEKEIVAISPWKANSKMTADNPYYLQFNPNLNTHFEKMIEEATANHSADRIFIISSATSTKDRSRVQLLQAIHATQIGRERSTIQELKIHPDSLMTGDGVFIPSLREHQSTGFILWNYNPKSESFVYNCLRKLNAEKGIAEVAIYGMPMMLNSTKIGVDLFNNLDINICTAKFVDRGMTEVRDFERKYYARYGSLPENDAIEAYDLMLYLGRNLKEYGTGFQFHIDGQGSEGLLQSTYQFNKFTPINYAAPRSMDNQSDEFGYFENGHLDVIHFEENRLKRKSN